MLILFRYFILVLETEVPCPNRHLIVLVASRNASMFLLLVDLIKR